jgi:hypothetical protein
VGEKWACLKRCSEFATRVDLINITTSNRIAKIRRSISKAADGAKGAACFHSPGKSMRKITLGEILEPNAQSEQIEGLPRKF